MENKIKSTEITYDEVVSWLDANDKTAGNILRNIIDNNDLDILPILADALEDAGCDNQFLLDHFRSEHFGFCLWIDRLWQPKLTRENNG